jgi:uncharacterized protein (TIGR02466 family)
MAGKVTQIFATPIYYDLTAGQPALNEVLAGTIRDLAANKPSSDAFRAHRGGYYSDGTFLESGLPGVDGVRAVINTALDAYFRALGVAHTIVRTDVHGWVALTRPGDYQTPHVHADAMLSGVYYCVMPGAPEPEGCIDFITPVSAQEMSFLRGLPMSYCRVQPSEGALVLFPSYLRHYTHPFRSGDERICVVFNARVQQNRV